MEENQSRTNYSEKPLRCIVKLGGAAITCKNELEKINEENLGIVSKQLRQAMMNGGSSTSSNSVKEVLGMDWSKRPGGGVSQISINPDEFGDQSELGRVQILTVTLLLFNCFQVTSLNLEIVRALARAFSFLFFEFTSVGMSPFASGWSVAKSFDSNRNEA
ncbi:hypothetical protein MKX03_024775, partial [Papaver bracteatum]